VRDSVDYVSTPNSEGPEAPDGAVLPASGTSCGWDPLLDRRIGVPVQLTRNCLTRPSPTGPGAPSRVVCTSNERLEFLGDAVLGLVVAEYTYRIRPELSDGLMSKIRASVVNTRVLAEVALDLGNRPSYLRLGTG
jgi:ribonuclease-3